MEYHARGVLDYQNSSTREVALVRPPTSTLIRPTIIYDLEYSSALGTSAEYMEYSERVFRLREEKRGTFFYREDRKYRTPSYRQPPLCARCGAGPISMFYTPSLTDGEGVDESTERVCPECYAVDFLKDPVELFCK